MEEKINILLPVFKNRMRISHDFEDDRLREILGGSISSITSLIGAENIEDFSIRELILERSRYVYNDSLEFFKENFLEEIYDTYRRNEGGVDGEEVSTSEDT
ncbi:hypothetical protein SAMN02745116_01777 [Pilibacter termitis]|uniref:Phage gp6-like head-tail connector protein n=1 Tax=Pilibacter termitis TaxID=263852 RepID=A0A1T4PDV8_9ENTE|nr:phage gp6-like head-tail connector protein [Pilibacter termitis]SJZ89755.1 hypothetical protein SAMN02745116_01777 [Pilibacter termitis]